MNTSKKTKTEENKLIISSAIEALTTKFVNVSSNAKTDDEIKLLEKNEYIDDIIQKNYLGCVK